MATQTAERAGARPSTAGRGVRARRLLPTLLATALGALLVAGIPRERPAAAAPSPEDDGFHREFAHEVPGIVAGRDFPYLRAVEAATRQRWFDDEDAWRLAQQAWEKTQAHARLLEPDGEGVRRPQDSTAAEPQAER